MKLFAHDNRKTCTVRQAVIDYTRDWQLCKSLMSTTIWASRLWMLRKRIPVICSCPYLWVESFSLQPVRNVTSSLLDLLLKQDSSETVFSPHSVTTTGFSNILSQTKSSNTGIFRGCEGAKKVDLCGWKWRIAPGLLLHVCPNWLGFVVTLHVSKSKYARVLDVQLGATWLDYNTGYILRYLPQSKAEVQF